MEVAPADGDGSRFADRGRHEVRDRGQDAGERAGHAQEFETGKQERGQRSQAKSSGRRAVCGIEGRRGPQHEREGGPAEPRRKKREAREARQDPKTRADGAAAAELSRVPGSARGKREEGGGDGQRGQERCRRRRRGKQHAGQDADGQERAPDVERGADHA